MNLDRQRIFVSPTWQVYDQNYGTSETDTYNLAHSDTTHVYMASGIFVPYVIVADSDGCRDSVAFSGGIRVAETVMHCKFQQTPDVRHYRCIIYCPLVQVLSIM